MLRYHILRTLGKGDGLIALMENLIGIRCIVIVLFVLFLIFALHCKVISGWIKNLNKLLFDYERAKDFEVINNWGFS